MQKTAHLRADSTASVLRSDLESHAKSWIVVGQIAQLSASTLASRKLILEKLQWFLTERVREECGVRELREFLAYLTTAHHEGEGRWGKHRSQLRPVSILTYYKRLCAFFQFLVDEEILEASPMQKVPRPMSRADQVQPFTEEQVAALIRAAKGSRHPRRDELIVLLLLDTGLRASELCGLRLNDVDVHGHRCTVLGKGNKRRTAYFGRATARALVQYLREFGDADPQCPIFTADRGPCAGEPMTRSGLLQLINRLGKAAQIESARCSPHTFRHTAAVIFLRAGGQVFALKELLGHTSLSMVNRYVQLAQADLENQHRLYSPVDRLARRAS